MALLGTKAPPKRNRPLDEFIQEQQSRRPALKVGKIPVKGVLVSALAAVVILALLGLASGYQEHITCKDIQVTLNASEDNNFLSMVDVKQIIGLDNGRQIIGEKMSNIQLLELEQAMRENPYVKDAEVYKSVKGIIYVEATLRKPIARLINPSGASYYIDETGHKFPSNRHHSANVILVRGNVHELPTPIDSLSCPVEEALSVIRHIHNDPFWHAQISEIRIKESGELILYPEIGSMYMEFGSPVRIAEKFNNLKEFYHQVVDEIGWKKYKGISVKYRGQVVAKKR